MEERWDTIIVGAGAAGLMTAITAARAGARVLLLDGKERIGAKILMSGGNRCNVTNYKVTESDYESENKHAVRNILRAFTSERAVEFFKEIGVEVELEPGGKYFPSTHSAKTVLDALIREAERAGVILETPRKVSKISSEGNEFAISGSDFSYCAKMVVLSTGGLSHPSTGSDGSGYPIAQSLGHHLVRTFPALTPLLTEDPDWKNLAGISFPVRLMLWSGPKKIISFEGGFLFTHFGFSGPTALNISRHWLHEKEAGGKPNLTVNFLPQENEEKIRNMIKRSARDRGSKSVKSFLSGLLPERLCEVLLNKIGILQSKILNQLSREEREKLIRNLLYCSLDITGVYGYQKAEVTAGGVDLSEIDTKTMESRVQPGLYLTGEILDADGRIGGFNFQWAWSTGFLAGQAIAKTVKGTRPTAG